MHSAVFKHNIDFVGILTTARLSANAQSFHLEIWDFQKKRGKKLFYFCNIVFLSKPLSTSCSLKYNFDSSANQFVENKKGGGGWKKKKSIFDYKMCISYLLSLSQQNLVIFKAHLDKVMRDLAMVSARCSVWVSTSLNPRIHAGPQAGEMNCWTTEQPFSQVLCTAGENRQGERPLSHYAVGIIRTNTKRICTSLFNMKGVITISFFPPPT